jgi:hypothetical protein
MTLPAVSVHQPWAFSIAYLGKSPENRGWATKHRGPIAIHATLKWDPAGGHSRAVQAGWRDYRKTLPADNAPRPWLGQDSLWITYGAVVAVAEIVGCHLFDSTDYCGYIGDQTLPGHPTMCSDWAAEGQWHWELDNVRPLRDPVPCRGAQRLWRLPPGVDASVRSQLAATERVS